MSFLPFCQLLLKPYINLKKNEKNKTLKGVTKKQGGTQRDKRRKSLKTAKKRPACNN